MKESLEARQEDDTVDVPWSYYSLRRWWNSAKDALAPWWAENSKEAYNSGLESLAAGLKNFSSSRKASVRARGLTSLGSSLVNVRGNLFSTRPGPSVLPTLMV